MSASWIFILIIITTFFDQPSVSIAHTTYSFGPFHPKPHYGVLEVIGAYISQGAVQLTPASLDNQRVELMNQSGRVMLKKRFKLWEERMPHSSSHSSTKSLNNKLVASFNTSFLINIYHINDSFSGEGLAFVIAPNLLHPTASHGQYLGLTNASTDGNTTNQFIAIEFDTFKQEFDPDANHIGLDINGVRSSKTVSLSQLGFELSPTGTPILFMVWIDYDGAKKVLRVFMADVHTHNTTKTAKPENPIMIVESLDISGIVSQDSYFGFTASTGSAIELNSVLRWNLTVQEVHSESRLSKQWGIVLEVTFGVIFLLVCFWYGVEYYLHNKSLF